MLKKAKHIIKVLNQLTEGHEDLETPQGIRAEFKLKYNNLIVGHLELENGLWKFFYSDEFKQQDNVHPLVQFPDKEKVYTNEELWPFFTIRIPGLNQPIIEKIIKNENIDRTNEVELLKRFGEKSISNPFKLITAA